MLPAAAVLTLEAKPLQLECQFYFSEDDEPGAPFHYSLDTFSIQGLVVSKALSQRAYRWSGMLIEPSPSSMNLNPTTVV